MGKKILMKLSLFVFAIFLIIYFVIQVKSIFIDAIETEYATFTTFDNTVDLKCYIVRSEELIKSDLSGTYNFVVSDGDKLSKNQTIANIYSTDSQFRIEEQKNDIEAKMEILNDSSVEFNYFTLNVSKIDKDVSGMLAKYRNCIESGEYSLGIQTKNELLVTLNKRYLVVNALTGFKNDLDALESKKESLESKLSVSNGSVLAPCSGFFYSDVDGYETILTPELLQTATVDSLLEAIDSPPLEHSEDVLGKIVSEFDWYTVCVTDKETAQYFTSGDYYEISYPYSVGQTIKSLLSNKIVQSDTDSVIMIFQSSKSSESFSFMRNQVAQIKLEDFSGLRIRKEALRIVQGNEGVYILNGNTIEFKRANKIYENDGYYIISVTDPMSDSDNEYQYLSMYDAVINNGKELYHGKTIG